MNIVGEHGEYHNHHGIGKFRNSLGKMKFSGYDIAHAPTYIVLH